MGRGVKQRSGVWLLRRRRIVAAGGIGDEQLCVQHRGQFLQLRFHSAVLAKLVRELCHDDHT